MRFSLSFRCGICFVLLASGCTPASKVPARTPVRGKVTFNGEALTTGTVSFIPATFSDGEFLRPATAEIQPDGTYVVSSFQPKDGLIPGDYKVSIVSYDVLPDPETPGQEVWAIPRNYGNPETSELTAEVVDDRKGQTLDFELEGEK